MTREKKTEEDKQKKGREYPKPKRSAKELTKFLIIAIILMVVADRFLWGGDSSRFDSIRKSYYAEQELKKKEKEALLDGLLPPEVNFSEAGASETEEPTLVVPESGAEYFEAPTSEFKKDILLDKESKVQVPKPSTKPSGKVKLKKHARAWSKGDKKRKIAIVIDDVGMNLKGSRAAMALPKEVTLAFLPYAKKVRSLSKAAREQGHELIIHAPMEAMDAKVSLGALALRTGMSPISFNTEFNKIAQSFDGYVGVNNHMGSRLTQDKAAMNALMKQLKRRNLFFLDSKTIHTSIAAQTAKMNGVPYAERDVFLDHKETPEFVAKALRNVERIARERGSVIAIGHPKGVTMRALEKWIPTLSARGYELVPLSALLRNRSKAVQDNIIQVKAGQGTNVVKVAAPANDNLDLKAAEFSEIETASGVEGLEEKGKAKIVVPQKTYQKLFLSNPEELEFEVHE